MSFDEELRDVRSRIVEEIRKELLGPGSEISYPNEENELISEPPYQRYSTGILYPRDKKFTDSEEQGDDEESDERELEFQNYAENSDNTFKVEKKFSTKKQDDNDDLDDEINLAMQNKPSSMGMTFFVKNIQKNLSFIVKYGVYRIAQDDEIVIPVEEEFFIPQELAAYIVYDENRKVLIKKTPIKKAELDLIFERGSLEPYANLQQILISLNYVFKAKGNGYSAYKRIPIEEKIDVVLSENSMETYKLSGISYIDNACQSDQVEGHVAVAIREVGNDISAVTVMLVNDRNAGNFSMYQPEIAFQIASEDSHRFVLYNESINYENKTEEEKSLEMLYCDKTVYATGHGVSVNWDINDGIGKLFTTFMPQVEVPKIDMNLRKMDRDVDANALSMQFLSDLDSTEKEDKITCLKSFVLSYSDWIDTLEVDIQAPEYNKKFSDKAKEHIALCRGSCQRMLQGIEILNCDENAWKSFELTNRAMLMQRIHGKIQSTDSNINNTELQDKLINIDYSTEENSLSENKKSRWRPFQLAFVLLSITSMVVPNSADRDLVDLIWFPTGGGKTEAYLGLTAFTIFYRRLSDLEHSGGVAVMMRYTLRLLASQQFTRASTLICACEKIRRDEEKNKFKKYNLGNEHITIGLWIGSSSAFNKNADAAKALKEMNAADPRSIENVKDAKNNFQVLKCPWCGTRMTKEADEKRKNLINAWGYSVGKKTKYFCTQEFCDFESELPILVVDEDIYKNPPTLLFGTVDKFAMMAWEKNVSAFFGKDDNRCPDLIIQDELHLISGPLGTIVGIYETAIDYLCSKKGIRPKIIASTATIRMAKEQCRALYNRDVRQFPAQGIKSTDSFFAKELDVIDDFGRLYVGLIPSGQTKVTFEARIIGIVLQKIDEMDLSDEVKDQFWTLTMYFNSIRELGKASSIIDDDVKDRMRRIVNRSILKKKRARFIGTAKELTGRVTNTQLNKTLEELQNVRYTKDRTTWPINTLLASNMISVGVDVERLNIMMLVGQPKGTSEYIQSSSRIGRQHPGLAITLYDGTKSRDRSHYEQFKPYHESFYKYVEPTGLTPFSAPSRDRAIHAVLVSQIRHSMPEMNDDIDANRILDLISSEKLMDAIKYLEDRIININSYNPDGMKDDSNDAKQDIKNFLKFWYDKADAVGEMTYGKLGLNDGAKPKLLKTFEETNKNVDAYETLTSMRGVDATIPVKVVIWEEEYEQ
ncbi:MAG: helicase-related protein [Bacillota bacterium]